MSKRKEIFDKILPIHKYGCYFRLVELKDAEFILSMRNNENLSKHLSETSNNLDDQIKWLKEYKVRETRGEEFYIICMSNDNRIKFGVNRIYDIEDDQFEIGSWLFDPNSPKDKAVLCHLFLNTLAFEDLQLKICKTSTRRDNKTVYRYLKMFYPTQIIEDDLDYHFNFEYVAWNKRKLELLKIFGFNE